MLGVATLKEMLGKTSEVRFEATRRGLGHEGDELFVTAGLCACRDLPARVSAATESAGGYDAAPAVPRAVCRTATVHQRSREDQTLNRTNS